MSAYETVYDHRSMIFDEVRNTLYTDAIKKSVTDASIVLDLGAGLGLHGLVAAACGAQRVYLVEPSPVIKIARQIAEENGLAARMRFFQGTIEETQLPEKVDVIISVFTGNLLLEEDLLPSLIYARDRYLKPGGVLLPERATMKMVPVSLPRYYERNVAEWDVPRSGIDFSCARSYAANTIYYDSPKAGEASFLASPVPLLELDFLAATEAACRQHVRVRTTASGLCHGWLGWFDALLADQWLSTSPHQKQTHWQQAFLPLEQPMHVNAGDTIDLELHRPESGEWTWMTRIADVQQRQSTFLSAPVDLETMRRKSAHHHAVLGERGEAALTVLRQLDGTASTATIAEKLTTGYPQLFPESSYAMRFVIHLIEEYS